MGAFGGDMEAHISLIIGVAQGQWRTQAHGLYPRQLGSFGVHLFFLSVARLSCRHSMLVSSLERIPDWCRILWVLR